MGNDNIFLIDATIQKEYEIAEIKSSRNKIRLLEFGFIKNKKIVVLKTAFNKSSLLVKIGTSCVGVDKETAQTIVLKNGTIK